ncbi:ribosome maturation factor RimP [Ornithinimicrobium cryptoxanthini]|uniref:Ribosome maturation factor RimP n=1 Tax=Ornithinimicrobium cryptoxanthini TaxID=2934161 RepID=A0ABY4YER1_9MICO|nr:ribosome maturation factor RimP [Ornithinimicrobium cryptoxanthini]USQ75149.1 ribosome maturation factor RimP [Ornithinimicrobium cryptoxanthini]
MGQAEQVRETAGAALAGSGVVVEDVAVHPAGKRRLVRVGVARDVAHLLADDLSTPVEPLTLDEVADASRVVGSALDDSDAMGAAPYTLEVSSLGVDHPLTTPAQFRRNVGRLLRVRLAPTEGEAGDPTTQTETESRLTEAGPDGIRLDGGTQTPEGLLPYDRIAAARVQVEFTRPGGKDN